MNFLTEDIMYHIILKNIVYKNNVYELDKSHNLLNLINMFSSCKYYYNLLNNIISKIKEFKYKIKYKSLDHNIILLKFFEIKYLHSTINYEISKDIFLYKYYYCNLEELIIESILYLDIWYNNNIETNISNFTFSKLKKLTIIKNSHDILNILNNSKFPQLEYIEIYEDSCLLYYSLSNSNFNYIFDEDNYPNLKKILMNINISSNTNFFISGNFNILILNCSYLTHNTNINILKSFNTNILNNEQFIKDITIQNKIPLNINIINEDNLKLYKNSFGTSYEDNLYPYIDFDNSNDNMNLYLYNIKNILFLNNNNLSNININNFNNKSY